jgi:hypothetical protein
MHTHLHNIILMHVNCGVRLCAVCSVRCAVCSCAAFEFVQCACGSVGQSAQL